jgi:alpha-glucosidase
MISPYMKKKAFLLLSIGILLFCFSAYGSENISVGSPDGTIRINIKTTDHIYYNLVVDGREVMYYSRVGMMTNQGDLGVNPKLKNSDFSYVNESIETVWGIRSRVENEYNQLKLNYTNGFSLIFRVYNDGFAYRFKTDFKGELIVYNEKVEYRFLENHQMVNQVVNRYTTSYEQVYSRNGITDIKPGDLVLLPSVVVMENLKLAILESDLYEYPGLYLTKNSAHRWPQLTGSFPMYPLKTEVGGDRSFNLVIKESANYIARTSGRREFPWRAMVIAREDKELLDSDLVYKLARPSKINTDWIRPGKVAWDWYNALNLHGVDFETGINNETYEYFIDFAAANNIEYIILDEGWSDQFDLFLPGSGIDMERISTYAESKGVKLILWAVWHVIDRQYEDAFRLFNKWGIAGVKVDFIDRDDQLAIEFYERFAKEAAKHKLLVNYHGCSKPAGLHRTYPNVINFEAVRGNEYNKFASIVPTPEHNVDISFIRMLAGPMDYTPGAMRNSTMDNYFTSFETPMSKGTRAHQIAMFILYFAPLQMLCDAPTQYLKYPDLLRFISEVPTSWDETIALEGKLGEYAVIARKKGKNWYIGGLTNWSEREIVLDISGFTGGSYKMKIIKDGINANRMAEDYVYQERMVNSSDPIIIDLKKGGGFALVLYND